MTRGEAINARARAGARMVDAREAFERVRGMRKMAPDGVRLLEQRLRDAKEAYVAAQVVEHFVLQGSYPP